MNINKIEFIHEKANPATLKIFPLFERFQTQLDDFFKAESKKLGYYNTTVITEDGYYITNPVGLKAAIENNEPEIDVLIAKGLTQGNYMRMASLGLVYAVLNIEDRFMLIEEVSNYLRNEPEGQAWAEEIGGNDINEKLGKIFGYHKEAIKYVKRLNKLTEESKPTSEEEVKSFRFSTDKSTLKFDGKRFVMDGKPKVSENRIVYYFKSEDSEINITIKSKKAELIQGESSTPLLS